MLDVVRLIHCIEYYRPSDMWIWVYYTSLTVLSSSSHILTYCLFCHSSKFKRWLWLFINACNFSLVLWNLSHVTVYYILNISQWTMLNSLFFSTFEQCADWFYSVFCIYVCFLFVLPVSLLLHAYLIDNYNWLFWSTFDEDMHKSRSLHFSSQWPWPIQCESKNPPSGFLKFFPKRLGIFNQFFTHLL